MLARVSLRAAFMSYFCSTSASCPPSTHVSQSEEGSFVVRPHRVAGQFVLSVRFVVLEGPYTVLC